MVGTGRFELPTPRTPSECSTRLSHVPTIENRCQGKIECNDEVLEIIAFKSTSSEVGHISPPNTKLNAAILIAAKASRIQIQYNSEPECFRLRLCRPGPSGTVCRPNMKDELQPKKRRAATSL